MNLQLSLKGKWFEMTKSGVKTEDYRDLTEYWIKRLFETKFKSSTDYLALEYELRNIGHKFSFKSISDFIDYYNIEFKKFDINTMTLGYPKSTYTERILKLEHTGIEIRTGNPEWGAEPNKIYFVIKHGKRII